MGIEENKALVKRWLRSNESGVPDRELLAPDINNHNIPPATPGGRQGTGALLEPFLNAFSDWNMSIHVMIAEGDEVAVPLYHPLQTHRRISGSPSHRHTDDDLIHANMDDQG